MYVYTIDPDSTKDEEPAVAAVNKQPSKGSQLSDPALLDGPPDHVCNGCMFVFVCVCVCVFVCVFVCVCVYACAYVCVSIHA